MWTSTSTPATRASRCRTPTSCSGTSPPPTKRGSRNEADPPPAILLLGGGLAAGLLVPVAPRAAETVSVRMRGDASGAHVGFDPAGVHLRPGDTVRWLNVDPGNAHTATAYHPASSDRPAGIPEAATPWDSDYLLSRRALR